MICAIPDSVAVLPAINSNFTHHINAGLANGASIVGQVAISYPSAPTALPDNELVTLTLAAADHDRIEDANLPGSLPALRRRHTSLSKDNNADLPARIERLWYINPYGHEIWPVANPKVLEALNASRTVIYSVGSLYTSIIPCVILRGVGAALADPGVRHKILVLNSKLDRETGPAMHPMDAGDFAAAIARAGAESCSPGVLGTDEELPHYVSHLLYLEGIGAPKVNVKELQRLGVTCVKVEGKMFSEGGKVALGYDEVALGKALEDIMDS
ncbi:hypothetical protein GQ53DRAFT_745542 [Thozetella sp. PMI_491]|nr:hypothetical protein GQ53DRAFT_745542 [Thozetella sp. PMI_491]